MKKSIHLLAAAASVAFLSVSTQANAQNDDGWNYYWNKSQSNTEKGLTPYSRSTDWKNEGRTSYFGIDGAYGINQDNNKIDMAGAYLTYAAYDNVGPDRAHQFLFMAGYMKGNETYEYSSTSWAKHNAREIPLILGYNYNLAVHDRILLYAGFRGGIVFGKLEVKNDTQKQSSSDTAALFGAGCGIKFAVTSRMDILVGYEYQRGYTRYFGENDYNGYHTLKAGVSFGF